MDSIAIYIPDLVAHRVERMKDWLEVLQNGMSVIILGDEAIMNFGEYSSVSYVIFDLVKANSPMHYQERLQKLNLTVPGVVIVSVIDNHTLQFGNTLRTLVVIRHTGVPYLIEFISEFDDSPFVVAV